MSNKPWECMDGLKRLKNVAEGGFQQNPSTIDPISNQFDNLMLNGGS